MKKKYIMQSLLSLFAAGWLFTSILSCTEEDIPNNEAPTLIVQEPSNLLRTSVTLSGSISGKTDRLKDYGFAYSTSNLFPSDQTTQVSMMGSEAISTLTTIVKGLTPNERYYYRMYATTGVSTVYSATQEFRTASMSAPQIGQMLADSIGEKYARFKFTIEDKGNEVLIECGVGYKKSDSKTFIPVAGESIDKDQYIIEITDLEANTEYDFRPYAKNAADADASTGSIEGYGNIVKQKTAALLSAEVETVMIADGHVGINSAKVVGKVLSAKGSDGEITECGFVWSTTVKSPTVDLNDGAINVNPQYDVLPYTFNADITGLNQSTNYYICAFAKNIVEGKERVAYGEVREIATLGLNTPALKFTYDKDEYGNQVYNYDRTANSIQVKSYITNYDGPACWEKGIIWSKTDAGVTIDKEPKNKIVVTSNDNLINGTITGLEIGTSYFIRTYAIYKAGESQTVGYTTDAMNCYTESFNTPSLNGTEINYNKITYNSAELAGKISYPGNGKITERGFVMSLASKTNEPTLENNDMIIKSDDSFITIAKNLKPATEYAVRSYVKCELGDKKETVYSWNSSFYTKGIDWPTFNNVTYNEEDRTFSSMKVTSGIASLGNTTLVEKGFCWLKNDNTNKEVTLENCTGSQKVDDGIQTEYSYNITGLERNTFYRIRAYAKVKLDDKITTVYSWQNEYATKDIQRPTIENIQYSADIASITVSATIAEQGDATITEVGFCCIATDKGNNPTIKDISVSQKFNFETNKDFSLKLEKLTPGISYYVNAFAKIKMNNEELIHYAGTYWVNTNSLGVDYVNSTPASTTCEVTARFSDNTCSEYGFVWMEKTDDNSNIAPEQATGKLKCTNMDTENKFSGTIENLTGGKTYYLWTYAVYSGKTIYNGWWDFATKRVPGQGDNVSPDKN